MLFKFFTLITAFSILSSCSDSKPTMNQRIAKQGVTHASISVDNHYTVYASINHGIGVWDNQAHKLLYQWRHNKNSLPNIVAISISGNNQYVLTAEKRNIILWDLKTGQSLRFLALPSDIQAIALSQHGSRALVGMLNAKALYIDLTTGSTLQSLQHLETINSVALSRDGKYALTGSDDKLAVLWDLANAKPLHQWPHKKRVRYVTFSPRSTYGLTSASQDSVNLWQVSSGKLISKIKHKSITTTIAVFSNDETNYALGLLPNRIGLYNTDSSKQLQRWQIAKYQQWKPTSTFVYGLSFDNNSLLSMDSNGMLSKWSIGKII